MKVCIDGVEITQCKNCKYHEVHEIVLVDDFDHDFGTYCSLVEDEHDSYERHTYSGRINKRMIGGDDWDVSEAEVPDWCPFVLKQYEEQLDVILDSSEWNTMMKTIDENPFGSQKLIAEHGKRHAKKVFFAAEGFLRDITKYKFNNFYYNDHWCSTQRDECLLAFAAMLHDVGASVDPTSGHTAMSVKIAKETFLSRTTLNDEDKEVILKAIANHSDGTQLVQEAKATLVREKGKLFSSPLRSELAVPVALLLGDKLDITADRIKDDYLKTFGEDPEFDKYCEEVKKIKKVEFKFVDPGKNKYGDSLPVTRAELHYTVDKDFDFNVLTFWSSCIRVPRMVAKDILGLRSFAVLVNGQRKYLSKF